MDFSVLSLVVYCWVQYDISELGFEEQTLPRL